jgi:hypothetical protein
MCKWCAIYRWKALDEGYNFALDLTSIRALHTKLWPPKVIGVPTFGIQDSHLGVPGQNDIWVLVLWPSIEYIIMGKMVASPKSGLWWVLWDYVCPWFIRAPKCSNYALTHLLFGLCSSMWVIDLLVNVPSPDLEAPTHPSTPEVLRTKERTPIPSSSTICTFGLTIESIKELGGASKLVTKVFQHMNHLVKI